MKISVSTQGHNDIINLTPEIEKLVKKSGVKEGMVYLFVSGSTAALTTLEYESGLIEDLQMVLEKIAPEGVDYKHHQRWGDHNGAAHIRAALMKPDLIIPIENGELILGTWQQVVLIDFDERPRTREIVIKVSKVD